MVLIKIRGVSALKPFERQVDFTTIRIDFNNLIGRD